MQRDITDLYAHRLYLFEQLIGKMQASRRRGGAAKLARVHGLIPLRVLKLFLYIWRQRHFAQPLQNLKEYPLIVEFYYPVSTLGHGLDSRFQLSAAE